MPAVSRQQRAQSARTLITVWSRARLVRDPRVAAECSTPEQLHSDGREVLLRNADDVSEVRDGRKLKLVFHGQVHR
jgi:hypothetical protein